ncbi:hypothetical protein R1sor_020195 [Riccia sorocarpa]|uniref:Uncharacterized protein n=1 Tax=Riccia sorocarpa TaxID=122646 RepID=A0ABD3IEL9_9MARC
MISWSSVFLELGNVVGILGVVVKDDHIPIEEDFQHEGVFHVWIGMANSPDQSHFVVILRPLGEKHFPLRPVYTDCSVEKGFPDTDVFRDGKQANHPLLLISIERTPSASRISLDRSPPELMERSPSASVDRSLSGPTNVGSVRVNGDEEEADAQALLGPLLQKPVIADTLQRRNNAPLLTRSDSVEASGNSSPYLWDIHKLSLCFFFVFLAYGATQNLESSLFTDKGLGSTSLGVLLLDIHSSEFVSFLVSRMLRTTLLELYTLIPASAYLGFTAAVLWVAEGTYITFAAKRHAAICSISEATALGRFNGEFWGAFAGTQVVGNLLSLALLDIHETPDGSSAGLVELFLVFLGSMTIGTILACLLRPHDNLTSRALSGDDSVVNRGYAKASFALLSERRMLFLICLLVYTGMQQAFIWGDFTRDIITPTLGLSWVGGVMAVYGASDTIASVAAGRFSSGLGSIAVILTAGACCQMIVMAVLYFQGTLEHVSGYSYVIFGAAIVWGIGDATFNTQISAVLGILYPNDTEVTPKPPLWGGQTTSPIFKAVDRLVYQAAAFAQWKIWQSLATSAAFFVSPYASLITKLWILLLSLMISVSLFLVVIWQSRRAGQS